MRDLKDALNARRTDSSIKQTPLVLEVEVVTHQLNRRRLRSIGALTPANSTTTRVAVCDCTLPRGNRFAVQSSKMYCQYVQCMPEQTRDSLNAAWPLVVESGSAAREPITNSQQQFYRIVLIHSW